MAEFEAVTHTQPQMEAANAIVELASKFNADLGEVLRQLDAQVAPDEQDGAGFRFCEKGCQWPDGRFAPVTLSGQSQTVLTRDGIARIAQEFDVPLSNVLAFLDVETRGNGYLDDGDKTPFRPKILFEAHWFYKLTPKPVSKVRPDLSCRRWDPSLYKGGAAEYDRLRDAMAFDPIQALKSASWGKGQVMGFNFAAAGCESIGQFLVEEFSSEELQLRHAMNFIEHEGLLDALRKERWLEFKNGYNGTGANGYEGRLLAADKKAEAAGAS